MVLKLSKIYYFQLKENQMSQMDRFILNHSFCYQVTSVNLPVFVSSTGRTYNTTNSLGFPYTGRNVLQ